MKKYEGSDMVVPEADALADTGEGDSATSLPGASKKYLLGGILTDERKSIWAV